MPDQVKGRAGSKIGPRHQAGQFVMVCADVIDMGDRYSDYNGKEEALPKVVLVYQSSERDDNGKPLEISIEFTNSLGAKANLSKFIGTWRGKSLTDDEKKDFDLTAFAYGRGALVTVEIKKGNDSDYSAINSVVGLPQGFKVPAIENYERSNYWADKKARYAEELEKKGLTAAA